MNINSHVQLPNCVLRNFRDETDPEKKVWYLDVRTGDILRKSSKKLGTRKGYYSETGERFWAENIENPLSIISRRIQKYCTGEVPCLQIPADDADACKRYIKAAFIRSKMAEDEMNKHSVTASICTEQSNHDKIIRSGAVHVVPCGRKKLVDYDCFLAYLQSGQTAAPALVGGIRPLPERV